MRAKGFSVLRARSFFFQMQRKENGNNMKKLGKLKGMKMKGLKGFGNKKGWQFEGTRHGMAAKGIKTFRKKKRKTNFKRGSYERAERNVLAKELEEHSNIDNPYALATYEVEQGAKIKNKRAIKANLKEQKMYNKEKREHPSFTKKQIKQIVKDHMKGKKSFAAIASMRITPKMKKDYFKKQYKKY